MHTHSMPASATTRPARRLSTADARRETLVAAAMPVFAGRGYDAASTAQMATAAGISHAYVFRLFPTKAELFAAVCGLARERMTATFRAALAEARHGGGDPLEAMGHAYLDLLRRDREVLLVQLHSQVVAAREPVIRDAMQQTFRELYDLVDRATDDGPEAIQAWFAHGMLCNVMAAIGAEDVDEPWARALAGGGNPDSGT